MRKRVYIAGPITKGDLASNINQATAAFVRLAKAGFAPLCPHWSAYSKPAMRTGPSGCTPMVVMPGCVSLPEGAVFCIATTDGNPEMTHADWLGVDLPWVEVADAVLRLPGESSGADAEVAHARKNGVPVYDDVEELIACEPQHGCSFITTGA
jgi:hypothetical protein